MPSFYEVIRVARGVRRENLSMRLKYSFLLFVMCLVLLVVANIADGQDLGHKLPGLLVPSRRNPRSGHSGELSAPASRGQNQPIAAVSAAGTPPNRDQVAFGDEAIDVDRDVRVRVAVCGMEMFELRGPVQIGA